MWYKTLVFVGLFVLMVGIDLAFFRWGQVEHRTIDHDQIVEQVLGEAECVRMDWIAPGPQGVIKVMEQQLCGYHLEWSTPIGGVPSEPFAPQPDEHRLGE